MRKFLSISSYLFLSGGQSRAFIEVFPEDHHACKMSGSDAPIVKTLCGLRVRFARPEMKYVPIRLVSEHPPVREGRAGDARLEKAADKRNPFVLVRMGRKKRSDFLPGFFQVGTFAQDGVDVVRIMKKRKTSVLRFPVVPF